MPNIPLCFTWHIREITIHLHCVQVKLYSISLIKSNKYKNKYMNKQSFKEIYEAEKAKPSAAQTFVMNVAKETHRTEFAVRSWLSGKSDPDPLVKDKLSKKFKVPVEVLFP